MLLKNNGMSRLASFLDYADRIIERAYLTKSSDHLSRVLEPALYDSIVDSLDEMCLTVRGNSAYKSVKWRLLEESSSEFCVLKETQFENIKLTRRIQIAVGEDKKEIWKVVVKKKEGLLKVLEIKEVPFETNWNRASFVESRAFL